MNLGDLQERGVLRPLDRHFGEMLLRLRPGVAPEVALAGALASRALAAGHVCLDLASTVCRPLADEAGEEVPGFVWPELHRWLRVLADSPVVAPEGRGRAPLVLRGHRLWLARYDAHERRLAARLHEMASSAPPPVDEARLEASMARLFGDQIGSDQAKAVRAAVRGRLVVLAGGPGTGKTTTVVRLVAALLEQAAGAGRPLPRVLLVAPTGKAAARMAESVRRQRDGLVLDPATEAAVRAAIPQEASTLHRALVPRNTWMTRMRYDADDPLAADVVVLDEASMVDLPLMARLVDALRPDARLVLVGDPNQLAAVGAGAVLAELCALAASDGGAGSPVARAVVRLGRSWRFEGGGGIGRLARALEAEDADAVHAVLREDGEAGAVLERTRLDRDERFLDAAVEGWRAYCTATDPAERLARLDRFRVLCATRVGPHGVVALGAAIERALANAGLVDPRDPWYDGRPVMVTHNDYGVQLFNGDIGVVGRDERGETRVFFEGPLVRDASGALVPGPPRAVLPSRLPPHETVWAMTVHKSQGSEFDEVLLALPVRPVPVLSKELLYTAVTRAKRRVVIRGDAAVLADGLLRRVERAGGLADALREAAAGAA